MFFLPLWQSFCYFICEVLKMPDYLVVKLGGSLVSTEKALFNTTLVKSYVSEIMQNFKVDGSGPRMILVIGGGYLSRQYRDFAKVCGENSDTDLHRVGMNAIWLNAEIIRGLLGPVAFEKVLGLGVYSPQQKEAEANISGDLQTWLSGKCPVLISGGFISGASTDSNAVFLASKIGVEVVYKLTDVDGVFTGDPDKDSGAKLISEMSWDQYLLTFGGVTGISHTPGKHTPVDLFAARFARDNKISMGILNGKESGMLGRIITQQGLAGTKLGFKV